MNGPFPCGTCFKEHADKHAALFCCNKLLPGETLHQLLDRVFGTGLKSLMERVEAGQFPSEDEILIFEAASATMEAHEDGWFGPEITDEELKQRPLPKFRPQPDFHVLVKNSHDVFCWRKVGTALRIVHPTFQTLVAHWSVGPDQPAIAVTEATTGLYITGGLNFETAAKRAILFCERIGYEKVMKKITATRERQRFNIVKDVEDSCPNKLAGVYSKLVHR